VAVSSAGDPHRFDGDEDGVGCETAAPAQCRSWPYPTSWTKVAEIPIPDDVARRLRRHFNERPITGMDKYVVAAPRGGPIRYTNWRSRVWIKIAERLDFEVTPHDLRRTVATRLFVEGRWTPAEVQAFLGYRDPRVTLSPYTLVNAVDLPQSSSMNTRST